VGGTQSFASEEQGVERNRAVSSGRSVRLTRDNDELTVNGQAYEHRAFGRLAELLRELDAPPDRTAVMVNEEVIPADKRQAVTLKESDRIEVIAFAGGG